MATATAVRSRYPETARRHYLLSQLVAQRAARQVARMPNLAAQISVIVSSQIAQATLSQAAVGEMLAEQGIEVRPDALLTPSAFTTQSSSLAAMIDGAGRAGLERLAASLVQDAGRAAESVATAIRPRVVHTRFLSPPSCSRCAVLAGRVYRWSDGFQRHPRCDCTMVPTTIASARPQDVDQLVRSGMVTGLSKADALAIRDGADPAQVVNTRSQSAGLVESGRVLGRAGRPTPEAVYLIALDRDEAVELLTRFGYVR